MPRIEGNKPLPAHWKCYLDAFDALLSSDTDIEARTMRKRMDRHLDHALTRDGVERSGRPKHKSSRELPPESLGHQSLGRLARVILTPSLP